VNLPVTNVTECIGSNAKTLEMDHLKFLDMGASGLSPGGTRKVLRGTDELLIHRNTIPGGETASPVQERSQRSQSAPPSFSPDRCFDQASRLCRVTPR